MLILAIVGSRTYPATQREWDRLTEKEQEQNERVARLRIHSLLKKLSTAEYGIISGGARGVDAWAIEEAALLGFATGEIHAEWDKYGKGAGFKRNKDIVLTADEVIAFWDGKSKGTLDTIQKARKFCTPVTVFDPDGTISFMVEKADYDDLFTKLPTYSETTKTEAQVD